jgi:hypothetical protein
MDPMTGDDPIRELTTAEAIKLRTAGSALDAALTDPDPDPDAREAAFRQWTQVGAVYEETRDAIHVPDDAGEHAEGLRRIMRRIPEGWGRWISCGPGWYPLLCELESTLAQLDPGFRVHQVKEKFGALCFYAHSEHYRGLHNPFIDAIREVEHRSAVTCELCGEPGGLCETGPAGTPGRWVKTMCVECAGRGYRGRTYFPSEGI